jgi:hypothetical protein
MQKISLNGRENQAGECACLANQRPLARHAASLSIAKEDQYENIVL